MKRSNVLIKKLEGRIDSTFNADDLYDELTQDWQSKAKQLQNRRWRKVMRQQTV